ncbi:MAG: hypothetical protein ACLQVD_20415 [Capsulimonadaceae bacterium]
MEETRSLSEIWARTFSRVQRDIDIPTVWLALQAVRPLTIDRNRFVVGIPPDLRYLSVNLESNEANQAVEKVLEEIMGRPMMFIVIEGETVADWNTVKAGLEKDDYFSTARTAEAPPSPAAKSPAPPAPTGPTAGPRPVGAVATGVAVAAPEAMLVFDSWEKLNEWVMHSYKSFPMIRYPHGQAKYLVRAAHVISASIDAIERGNDYDRLLSRVIERLASNLNLDPLFVALEVMRYRYLTGKDTE